MPVPCFPCPPPPPLSDRAEDIYRVVSGFLKVPLTEVRGTGSGSGLVMALLTKSVMALLASLVMALLKIPCGLHGACRQGHY